MAYSNLIENLTQELALFQKMGGDIYSPRRSLPYYERMRSAKRAYEKETGKELSYEDIYRDCGIKFNRDYNTFSQFVEGLSTIATPDKKVDIIKTSKLPADKVELKLVADGSSTYLAIEVNLSEDYINNLKDFIALAEK